MLTIINNNFCLLFLKTSLAILNISTQKQIVKYVHFKDSSSLNFKMTKQFFIYFYIIVNKWVTTVLHTTTNAYIHVYIFQLGNDKTCCLMIHIWRQQGLIKHQFHLIFVKLPNYLVMVQNVHTCLSLYD